MNASRLRGLLDHLIELNSRHRIAKLLSAAHGQLSNLAGEPSNASHQQALVASIVSLENAESEMLSELTPAQLDFLDELDGHTYFDGSIADFIREILSENPATPSVARDKLGEFQTERNTYLENITKLRDSMEQLGIVSEPLEEGQAEVGFLIPREVFESELNKLIAELRILRRMVRAFSEASTGGAEEIEVRSISTSDPLFFFGLGVPTIIAIGKATTWALSTWKQVEEIRKIRAETEHVNALKDGEVAKILDAKITETIEAEVKKEADRIAKASPTDGARKNEQRTDLEWTLKSLLAHIERGVTIDIRLAKPSMEVNEEGEPREPPEAYQTLQKLTTELIFPPIGESEPILQIPAPPGDDNTSSRNASTRRRRPTAKE